MSIQPSKPEDSPEEDLSHLEGGIQPENDYKAPTPPKEMGVRIYMPEGKPIVTYVLIGFTALIYLAQVGTESILGYDLPVYLGVKVNELIKAGQYWRLFTPIFLHGGLMHIGVNMYSLHALGPQLERHYGHWKFLTLYLISGIAGVVASFLFNTHASLGASTSIFGLLGAYGVFFYQNQKIFSGARSALNRVLQVGALNLMIGLSAGIDNWGHVGGLLGGVVLSWGGGPLYEFDNVMSGEKPGVHLKNKRGEDLFIIAAAFTLVTSLACAALGIFFF